MSALFKSIDETLTSIKDEHGAQSQAFKDRIVALELELTLHKDISSRACADRDQWMRVATKLITQFSVVEQVFSDAKAMALAMEHDTNPEQKNAITHNGTGGTTGEENGTIQTDA